MFRTSSTLGFTYRPRLKEENMLLTYAAHGHFGFSKETSPYVLAVSGT